MPEGDTILRTAVGLRRRLEGRTVDRCRARDASIGAEELAGAKIASIEARGKHLLLHTDCRRTVHSHMGMTGSWHLYRPGEAWRKPQGRAALVLETAEVVAVCFSPKTLELLTPDALRRHRFLSRLGRDLLATEIDRGYVLERFRRHRKTPVGVAVLDQSIVCGIGNVYKSEMLFLARIAPFTPVERVGDERLWETLETCRELMRRNLEGYPRRTRFGRVGGRLWVYGRSGERCYVCGSTIELRRQGVLGRTTYFCPECQPVGDAGPLRSDGLPEDRPR